MKEPMPRFEGYDKVEPRKPTSTEELETLVDKLEKEGKISKKEVKEIAREYRFSTYNPHSLKLGMGCFLGACIPAALVYTFILKDIETGWRVLGTFGSGMVIPSIIESLKQRDDKRVYHELQKRYKI